MFKVVNGFNMVGDVSFVWVCFEEAVKVLYVFTGYGSCVSQSVPIDDGFFDGDVVHFSA